MRYWRLLGIVCAAGWGLLACAETPSEAETGDGGAPAAQADRPAPEPAKPTAGQNEEPYAYADLVMTEAHFINNGYVWSDPDLLDFEIRNPATGKALRMRKLDLKQKSGGKPPKEAAEALIERLKAELGEPPPSNPNAPRLPQPLFSRTQGMHIKYYPEIWQSMKRDAFAAAPQRIAARDPEVSRELRSIVMDSIMAYGESHPFTMEMIDAYQKTTGEILLVDDSGRPGAGFTTYTRAEAEQYADNGIRVAGEQWEKNRERSIKSAKSALRLRKALYGEGHPKVAEVERMLQAAEAQKTAP